jgi:hypothetical protein
LNHAGSDLELGQQWSGLQRLSGLNVRHRLPPPRLSCMLDVRRVV